MHGDDGVLNTQDNDRGTDETKGKECPDIDQFCNLLYRKATGGKCNADSGNDGRNVGVPNLGWTAAKIRSGRRPSPAIDQNILD